MSTTLPLYWNLSSADKGERVDASVKLVSAVLDFQAQFAGPVSSGENASAESSDEDEDEDNEKLNDLDKLNAEDVRYAIRRLVRGLASPRESSRLGFAVALTELLSRLSTVSAEQIIALVMNFSQTQGSMQGHEIRDQYFARLFGFVSIIQSGLLFRNSTLPTSGSSRPLSTTLTDFENVAKELLALSEKKSWLKESCWWALGLQLSALSSSAVSWKDDAFSWIAETIYSDNQHWSSEKLAFTINFQRAARSLQWKKFIIPTFKDADVLSSRNIPIVARLLRDAPIEEDSTEPSAQLSGPWKPQLHYAWKTIFSAYFPAEGSPPPNQSSFQEFYRAAVDESLFSNTASPERKSWGFSVFQLALSAIPPSEIPLLFTQNFMRTWINHLSGHDRSLHKTARQVANSVQAIANKHPAIGFTLVLQLVGRHGSKQFDRITRTKTVEGLIASANVDGVKGYIQFLQTHLLEESSTDAKALDAQRMWAIDQLAALIRNTAVPREDAWILSIVELLVVHSFFSISKKSPKSPVHSLHVLPKPDFSDTVKQACRQRLYACLADLTSQSTLVKAADGKTSKQAGVASDGQLWLEKARELIKSVDLEKHTSSLVPTTPKLMELRGTAEKLVARLTAITDTSRQHVALGTVALVQSLALQTYDPELDSTESLQNSVDCAQKMFPTSSKKKRKSGSDSVMEVDEDGVLPIDEMVDILIGFLEGSTAFSRSVATFTFGHLTSEVQLSTLDFILKQLDEKNLDQSDPDSQDEEDENEEGEDDQSEGSDAEAIGDVESLDSDAGAPDSGDDDDTSTESENEDYDIEADDELRHKIAAALNMKSSDDEANEEEDDDLMDDDQMLKMDEQLAAVFRMQQGPKSDRRRGQDVKREATHFKNRVLDFLELFVKNEPSSAFIPTLVLPLVEIVRSARADEIQFTEKGTNLLSRISNIKQVPESFEAGDKIVEQLNELHELSRKAPSAAFESVLAASSLYLSKVIASHGRSSDVADAYRESLKDFVMRKGSRLNLAYFQSWIKRQASVAWLIRGDIVTLSGIEDPVNEFRRLQTIQLLQDLTSQSQSMLDSFSKADVIEFLIGSQQVLGSILAKAAASQETDSLNANQVKQILRCALQTVRLAKRVVSTAEEMASIWRPEAISALLTQFEQNPRFKKPSAVTSMCKELLAMISSGVRSEKDKSKRSVEIKATPADKEVVKEKSKKGTKRKADRLDTNGPELEPSVLKKKKKSKAA